MIKSRSLRLVLFGAVFLTTISYILPTSSLFQHTHKTDLIKKVREIPFTTLSIGSMGPDLGVGVFKIESKNSWEDMVRKLPDHPSKLPNIDFSSQIVLVVSSGMKSSGGYSVNVVKVVRTEDQIQVVMKETFPPKGSLSTMALTYPYHAIIIDKTSMPIRLRSI